MKEKVKQNIPLRLVSVDRGELAMGCLFILISFLMPLVFNVHSFNVDRSLMRALQEWERTDLLAAALQLVALNSLRGIPHYVGAYFVGESLSFRFKDRRAWPVNSGIILVILLLTYWGIGTVHRIHYDFGLPAMLCCFFVFFFRKIHYRYISLWKKACMIVLVLTSLQFMDVMPAVSAMPVGRGETSADIKLASQVLMADTVLNMVALVGMILFVVFALLLFFQLRDENNLKELSILREQNQKIMMQYQLNEMKNRTNQEMQYLVHDLKSPLTAVQTLVGVLKMESEAEQRTRDIEYLDYIENAVERMSNMISEILYENLQSPVTTQELVNVALSQSSVTDYAPYLHVDNQIPDVVISANRFLFPRALINLLQNSADAIPPDREPEIWLRVERAENGAWVAFCVEDNGVGIEKDRLHTIWNRGASGRQSSGLGLPFVQNVVEQMGGEIRTRSTPGVGTRISLEFPEEHCEGE